MSKTSQLLLPRAPLAGCIFAAIVRDTRGTSLSDNERLNHFPASPLVAITFQFTGQTYLTGQPLNVDEIGQVAPLPRISVTGPQDQPISSWNAGPVFAITIGFYPDAWEAISKTSPKKLVNQMFCTVPDILGSVIEECNAIDDAMLFWSKFQDGMAPLWNTTRNFDGPVSSGRQNIANWVQSLIARAAISGAGQSLRTVERRLRQWTGQNRQTLSFYAKIEDLHHVVVNESSTPIAGIANQAGYADQSHMGRAVRRATGFSPARLNKLIATQEAFWCYRLLGERF